MAHRTLVIGAILLASAAADASMASKVRSSGVTGGLVVHLNCGDGRGTAELRIDEKYRVHGLDTSDASLQSARERIRAAGVYGPVAVYKYDGKRLPYVDNFVNLIVADRSSSVPKSEIMRVLAPLGVALIGSQKFEKKWPDNIDEWTHYLGSASNNAVAKDTVIDSPRSMQWTDYPRWGRSHEELASMSASVSTKGRVFYIADEAPLASIRFFGRWALIARDAFNGTLLWKTDIPKWNDHLRHFRSGPLHLPRRLVAFDDRVFVTLGLDAPVTALDAATGKTIKVYGGTEHTEEILIDNGILYLAVGTSEVERKGGLHMRGEPKPSGFRHIAAVDANSGRQLWKKSFTAKEYLLPLSLTARNGSVFYQDTFGVARLDAKTGKEIWKTRKPTPELRMGFSGPTVVATDEVLLLADRVGPKDEAQPPSMVKWGVHGWNESGYPRKGKTALKAYAIQSGKEMWSADCSEGYNSPVDIFVIGDTVWVGLEFKGLDLKTGNLKKKLNWKGPKVGMPHHRCYRNKATSRLILTGRSGIEVVSPEKGWLSNNSWIRGTCQYGIMPCNGLIYAPPDACACFSRVKVQGFFAAAPRRRDNGEMPFDSGERLERGPAFGTASGSAPSDDDWPMYRRDAARSGSSSTKVSSSLDKRWSASIGGKLTQAVVVGDKVFVASIDTHTLHALNAGTGSEVWTYTAGSRIDSAPTVNDGLVYFGSADGFIHCLRATDGEVAWRFRAAPTERLVSSFGQLESAWPVHGAVLLQNGSIYATAGRSTYLDCGLVLYKLDAKTGKEQARKVIYDIDPKTDKQIPRESGFDMDGTISAVMSGDGDSVYMKEYRFDANGNRVKERKAHLFAVNGFLGEEWFVRSYWVYGHTIRAGWGGWAAAAGSAPFGRIMSIDGDKAYAYGRTKVASAAVGHKLDAYQLSSKSLAKPKAPTKPPQPAKGKKKRGRRPKATPPKTLWADSTSLIVRAMAVTSDYIIVAGVPDVGRKNQTHGLAFDNEKEALASFMGRSGVVMRVVSKSDGKTVSNQKLTFVPVHDGMSVAQGCIFLSLRDGTVQCWRGR